jgi:exodeoxyribonuclease VII large subunit
MTLRYEWDAREFRAWGRRPESASASVLTVSELVLRASNALEAEFGTVAVEGEISSLKRASSGHLYWTLKDASSAVECVMYKSDNERLRFALADGAHVVVVARPTIYRVRGRFQLTVVEVMPHGRGALHLRFEELRERLGAEGLFELGRKRRLPYWPSSVGIVTSAEGAAVRDICTIIRRRAPATRIVLKPVPVQGREAAPEIARAIRWFAIHRVAEVLIIGRGGGSLEDLWAFNEEVVVRAIAESPLPIVSAVGHESDTTLADFAADLRAPTPSAAAEAVVPEAREIGRQVVGCFRRLARAVERQRLVRIESALAPIKRYGFRRVRDRAREARQRWGEAVDSMGAPVVGRIDGGRTRVRVAGADLGDPVARRLGESRRRLERAHALARELARRHERIRTRHAHLLERLHAVNPLAILDRGYAIVAGPDGLAVVDVRTLARGDALAIRVSRGRIGAVVQETIPEPSTEPGEETP